jgi:hypothetical protein
VDKGLNFPTPGADADQGLYSVTFMIIFNSVLLNRETWQA